MKIYLKIFIVYLIIFIFTLFLISPFNKTSKIVGEIYYKNVFGLQFTIKQILIYPLAVCLFIVLIITIAKTKIHIRLKNLIFQKKYIPQITIFFLIFISSSFYIISEHYYCSDIFINIENPIIDDVSHTYGFAKKPKSSKTCSIICGNAIKKLYYQFTNRTCSKEEYCDLWKTDLRTTDATRICPPATWSILDFEPF